MTISNAPLAKAVGTTTPTRSLRGKGREGIFTTEEATSEPDAIAASSTQAVHLGGLLAAQENGMDTPRDRSARRHGQQMLDLLRELQNALLATGEARAALLPAALPHLSNLADNIPEADNPRLALILRAIAVRAAVELARHGDTVPGRLDLMAPRP